MITIFTGSTGYLAFKDDKGANGLSYVDMFNKECTVGGYWRPGFNIFDLLVKLHENIIGTNNVVVLHFGITEALTSKAANFLHSVIAQQLFYNTNYYFQVMLYPKMLQAIESIVNNRKEYFRYLEPYQFDYLYRSIIARMLEGQRVIIIGMSRPNTPNQPWWVENAREYETTLRSVSKDCHFKFIEVWDSLQEYVVDSSHLTETGHKLLYNKIKEIINEP